MDTDPTRPDQALGRRRRRGRPAAGTRSGNALPLANRIAESALPAPFTMPFTRATGDRPGALGRDHRLLPGVHAAGAVEIIPGLQTPVWGYNGMVPGPTFRVRKGRAGRRPPDQQPAARCTRRWATRPGPRSTCTARRRCRSTTATPATSPTPASSRTTATRTGRTAARSGTTTTACTTRPRTSFMGLAGMYQLTDPLELALPLPNGRVRRPADRRATRCSTADGSACCSTPPTARASTAT